MSCVQCEVYLHFMHVPVNTKPLFIVSIPWFLTIAPDSWFSVLLYCVWYLRSSPDLWLFLNNIFVLRYGLSVIIIIHKDFPPAFIFVNPSDIWNSSHTAAQTLSMRLSYLRIHIETLLGHSGKAVKDFGIHCNRINRDLFTVIIAIPSAIVTWNLCYWNQIRM